MSFLTMERATIVINPAETQGDPKLWRHSIGIGGVNHEPLPRRVSLALQKLKPRLIRIFLQEYFNIYPDHGVFDWSRLDLYMDALEQTGAKVLATVCLKPPVLFPRIDENLWMPNDIEEYQSVIRALVQRYSVDRKIVTHWEHANETDIGELGGCPFLMRSAEQNHEFYKMLIKPVLEVFPEAKVGGPAIGVWSDPMLKGFVELCHAHRTPLHFVSWHSYNNDCANLAVQTETVRRMLDCYGGDERPELMINEMNKGFDFQDMEHPTYHLVSVEEQAYQSKRAAFLASAVITMVNAGLDWSHYYHAWDCGMRPGEFSRFFSANGVKEVMYRHWNETMTRFGLFSDDGRVRPQFFVYWLFGMLEGARVKCATEGGHVDAIATNKHGRTAVLISNYSADGSDDRIAMLCFSGLKPGMKRLTVYRIDDACRWSSESLELQPVETRRVDVMTDFGCQCFCPADSVVALLLDDMDGVDEC